MSLPRAEELLKSIRAKHDVLVSRRDDRDKEIEAARARHRARIEVAKTDMDADIKALIKMMKAEHREIFGEGDRAELVNGVLYYAKEAKVSIPRGADKKAEIIATIEGNEWGEGIIITKDLDRPVITNWPEERLAVIGAKRKVVDAYSYDLVKQGGEK